MWSERVVDGYLFVSMEDVQLAQQEKKKVEYLEKYLDYRNPESVLKVYKKALTERIFKTPVGYDYLHKMQKYLLDCDGMTEEQVPPVSLQKSYNVNMRRSYTQPKPRVERHKEKKKPEWPVISLMANLVLIIAIIAMFAITLKSDNPNILNYERAIVNKYASWEQELSEREKVVREKERELNIINE
ncbi:MAG: hypothetical protein J1E83_01965 [Lachnospiraceae bacterium]|nr:hypothetical protein [Lachnospiraceae bacterium]